LDVNDRKRLPKNRRSPEAFLERELTERSLDILGIIARYRIVPTSAIVRLVDGNEDVTHRHLQLLYHRDLVGRVNRPGTSRNTEYAYFIEKSLRLRSVLPRHRLKELGLESRQRRSIVVPSENNGPGRQLFLEHEIMISDFRAALEIAARNSDNRVVLEAWKQGTETWDRVRVNSSGARSILPHRPDAYFVLQFPTAAEGQQRGRFFYEADRGTTNTTRFNLKLQAYLSFFLTGQYAEKYQSHKVRAVLIQAITQKRMQQLMAVASALAQTEPLAGALFWFVASDQIQNSGGFAAVWSTVQDERKRSVLD